MNPPGQCQLDKGKGDDDQLAACGVMVQGPRRRQYKPLWNKSQTAEEYPLGLMFCGIIAPLAVSDRRHATAESPALADLAMKAARQG
jgi:hypothetical protein